MAVLFAGGDRFVMDDASALGIDRREESIARNLALDMGHFHAVGEVHRLAEDLAAANDADLAILPAAARALPRQFQRRLERSRRLDARNAPVRIARDDDIGTPGQRPSDRRKG